jgi:methionyl aminopeptidase
MRFPHLKNREEIDKMRTSGKYVAEILFELKDAVKPGVSTGYLNEIALKEIKKRGGTSPFLNYQPHEDTPPFPAVICTSVNEQVVHGIPSDKVVLKQGDIVGIDLGVVYDGYVGDAAITVPVGKVSKAAQKLAQVTQQSLMEAILRCREPFRLGDLGHSVQHYAESFGYSVVRKYFGHGIGRQMHEEPPVPNYGKPGYGARFEPGLVIAIEPMINEGTQETVELDDGWTVVTADGKLSAHFEHTVAITESGPEILTKL